MEERNLTTQSKATTSRWVSSLGTAAVGGVLRVHRGESRAMTKSLRRLPSAPWSTWTWPPH